MHVGWGFRNPNALRRPHDQQVNGEDQTGHPANAEIKQSGPDDRDALPEQKRSNTPTRDVDESPEGHAEADEGQARPMDSPTGAGLKRAAQQLSADAVTFVSFANAIAKDMQGQEEAQSNTKLQNNDRIADVIGSCGDDRRQGSPTCPPDVENGRDLLDKIVTTAANAAARCMHGKPEYFEPDMVAAESQATKGFEAACARNGIVIQWASIAGMTKPAAAEMAIRGPYDPVPDATAFVGATAATARCDPSVPDTRLMTFATVTDMSAPVANTSPLLWPPIPTPPACSRPRR